MKILIYLLDPENEVLEVEKVKNSNITIDNLKTDLRDHNFIEIRTKEGYTIVPITAIKYIEVT